MALERKDEIGGLWLQCNLVLTVRATLVQDNEDSGNETKHEDVTGTPNDCFLLVKYIEKTFLGYPEYF